ncbi:MAG: IS110 family transposase [Candidatus Scalindua sp.]
MNEKFVGIDVSKFAFDLNVNGSDKVEHFKNDVKDIKKCSKALVKLAPALVVIEATGGYEMNLAMALQQAGLAVSVINPARIRNFAKAAGILAKTDNIDARAISFFASALKPPTTAMITESTRKVKSLVARRGQLIRMRTAELNRQGHAVDKFVDKSLKATIKLLDKQIESIDKEIKGCISNDPEMNTKADIVESVPGIGEVTATMLVTELPELGLLTRRQIASLVGLAPIARDSGTFKGKRMTGGGRGDVRAKLYMPTLVAIQYNPAIRGFYQRLLKAGKTKMTAVTACMRKMLTILNAMVAKKEYWNSELYA